MSNSITKTMTTPPSAAAAAAAASEEHNNEEDSNDDDDDDDEGDESTTTMEIDLLTCTAQELGNYLLQHRFHRHEDTASMACTRFLMEVMASLPNSEQITQQLLLEDNDDDSNDEKDMEVEVEQEEVEDDALLRGEPTDADADAAVDQNRRHRIPDLVSFTQPRGKFRLEVCEERNSLIMRRRDNDDIVGTMIPGTMISHVVIFPKPQDYTKKKQKKDAKKRDASDSNSNNGGDMVLLMLSGGGIAIRTNNSSKAAPKKRIQQVCFQLPAITGTYSPRTSKEEDGGQGKNSKNDNNTDMTDPTTEASSSPSPSTNDDDRQHWMISLLKKSLLLEHSTRIVHAVPTSLPQSQSSSTSSTNYRFSSYADANTSTTTSNLPFISCYYGTHDGVLFPLSDGILFVKPNASNPVLFLPRSILTQISSTGTNRYVTLTVHTANANTKDGGNEDGTEQEQDDEDVLYEFTNIHKTEQAGLQKYIHEILIPAMQRDLLVDNNGGDDEEEEGDNTNNNKTSASSSSHRKRKRAAPGDDDDGADEEDSDDDDDDEDFNEEEEDDEEEEHHDDTETELEDYADDDDDDDNDDENE